MPDSVYVWSSSRRECLTASRRTREVLAASSKADVLRTIGETCSPNPVAFSVETATTSEELAVARSAPGVIFWRSFGCAAGEWWQGTDGSRVRWSHGGTVLRKMYAPDEGSPGEASPGSVLERDVILDTAPNAIAEHMAQLLRDATPQRLHIITGFLRERLRQNRLHPFDSSRPDGTGGPEAELAEACARAAYETAKREGRLTWRHTLDEEVMEAFAADNHGDLATELIQVMATAGKWLEALAARGVKVRLP